MAILNQCQNSYLALLFVVLVVWTSRVSSSSSRVLNEQMLSMMERHEQWMTLHGRIYKDAAEKMRRFEIFRQNIQFIETFNAGIDMGYKLSINEFADLTNEEFRASHNGYKSQPPELMSRNNYFRYANTTDVPATMDWRKKGVVTPVKNQGNCRSCWAFAAVAAVEGITQLSTGKLISLSEQEIVDCDIKGRSEGCRGGYAESAFKFIKHNQGLSTDANYPYNGLDGTCKTKKMATPAATITGYEYVPKNNEKALLHAVAHQPVSVYVNSSGLHFQFYSSGVYTGKCDAVIDHVVTAVGYGTAGDGTKYWILKNSWGTQWGENGYMRIQRDVAAKEGLCGLATKPSYPTP